MQLDCLQFGQNALCQQQPHAEMKSGYRGLVSFFFLTPQPQQALTQVTSLESVYQVLQATKGSCYFSTCRSTNKPDPSIPFNNPNIHSPQKKNRTGALKLSLKVRGHHQPLIWMTLIVDFCTALLLLHSLTHLNSSSRSLSPACGQRGRLSVPLSCVAVSGPWWSCCWCCWACARLLHRTEGTLPINTQVADMDRWARGSDTRGKRAGLLKNPCVFESVITLFMCGRLPDKDILVENYAAAWRAVGTQVLSISPVQQ